MRTLTLITLAAAVASANETVPFRLHGQAWTEIGRVMDASRKQFGNTADSIDVSGSSLQSTGGQIVVEADLGEKLTATIGVGARQISNSLGIFVLSGSENYTPYAQTFTTFRGYVAQANLTYFEGDRENPWFSVTMGNYSHIYNRDAHNLGAYLLRGPVYPGILISGFQQFELDSTKATQMGVKVHHKAGNFSHDLLFINEHELPPTFDWSLAYIAKYRPLQALEIGAGVNFHRLVPYESDLMKPGKLPNANPRSYEVDDAGDTLYYTHQGTKLMAMFSLDLKHWFPLSRGSHHDLRLYGEAALIGVKNQGSFYDDPLERIPVMLGFNFPTFGWLDRLSVEAEWYGSPYRNDLYYIGNPNSMVAPWRWNPQRPVPIPVPVEGESKDDSWRWSILFEKNVASHIRFTGQLASDHHRPLPFSTGLITQEGGTEAAFSSPSEWYFMARLGFFF